MVDVWDETTPPGTENPKLGDDRIREMKRAIRERCAVDHDWQTNEGPAFGQFGSTIGMHKRVTLLQRPGDQPTAANQMALYSKEVNGQAELFLRHENLGPVQQLTNRGKIASQGLELPYMQNPPETSDDAVAIFCSADDGDLYMRGENDGLVTRLTVNQQPSVPSGSIILFETDTAISGYTLLTNIDDSAVYVTSGSTAGGETGGTVKAGGTWSQPVHRHGPGSLELQHNHQVYKSTGDNKDDQIFDANGNLVDIFAVDKDTGFIEGNRFIKPKFSTQNGEKAMPDWFTGGHLSNISGTTSNGVTESTWRFPGINYTRQQRI